MALVVEVKHPQACLWGNSFPNAPPINGAFLSCGQRGVLLMSPWVGLDRRRGKGGVPPTPARVHSWPWHASSTAAEEWMQTALGPRKHPFQGVKGRRGQWAAKGQWRGVGEGEGSRGKGSRGREGTTPWQDEQRKPTGEGPRSQWLFAVGWPYMCR